MNIKKDEYLLKIYQCKNKKLPFINWLESIKDTSVRVRIKNKLRRIEMGNFGDYKFLDSGVFELRLHFGSGYRIYFGKIKNTIILLLCGGDKKTQKNDIKKAKEYWKDYKINS
ncbi:MAG: type II toxin-antitoxin system RelE/ParE family toxin [Patescibacteria group bacterium]|nr:type II toxin-antitoxin system RelE/ParE family toxin [Patescibacteria group bacterium]